jgi:hypothetical protein
VTDPKKDPRVGVGEYASAIEYFEEPSTVSGEISANLLHPRKADARDTRQNGYNRPIMSLSSSDSSLLFGSST